MKRRQRLRVWVALMVFALPLLWAQAAFAHGNPPDFGEPLNGLTAQQLTAFNEGKTEFTKTATVASGLGPVFNGRSCGGFCHRTPAVGGGSVALVTRIGTITNGVFDPLEQFGGSLLQANGIKAADGSPHDFDGELPPPPEATIVAKRRATPLFGLGLVDAVPEKTLIRLSRM